MQRRDYLVSSHLPFWFCNWLPQVCEDQHDENNCGSTGENEHCLEPDESATGTITTELEAEGAYELTVNTDDDSDTVTVNVI